MTPADQMSDAGSTADLSTSGAMNLHQGSQVCHSTPRLDTWRKQLCKQPLYGQQPFGKQKELPLLCRLP